MDERMMFGIAQGLASGAEKAANTLTNVMKAQYEMKQQKELLDLKKKAVESDLAMAPYQRELVKQQIESSKNLIGYHSKLADLKQQEADQKLKSTQAAIDMVNNSPFEYSISSGPGGMNVRPKPTLEIIKSKLAHDVALTPGQTQVYNDSKRPVKESFEDMMNKTNLTPKPPAAPGFDFMGAIKNFGSSLMGSAAPAAAPAGIKQFNSPDEADKSGLPAGTVVSVGGRKYQI